MKNEKSSPPQMPLETGSRSLSLVLSLPFVSEHNDWPILPTCMRLGCGGRLCYPIRPPPHLLSALHMTATFSCNPQLICTQRTPRWDMRPSWTLSRRACSVTSNTAPVNRRAYEKAHCRPFQHPLNARSTSTLREPRTEQYQSRRKHGSPGLRVPSHELKTTRGRGALALIWQ